jgi:hypothetical protein
MKLLAHYALWPALGLAGTPAALHAWGDEGHQIVNAVALASLPADFPAWARTPENSERIVFLSSEPDRWRNGSDKTMRHATKPDHEFNLEEVPEVGIDLATLTPFRYEFVVQFMAARAAHASEFKPINPQADVDHVFALPGFLPWAIDEYYGKLQVAFSYLKVYEKFGTASEAANARANIVEMMGVMGHYVGDGSQPLHVTKSFNGWTGPNPNGFTVRAGIHGWIDSGFILRAGIKLEELLPRVRPAEPVDTAPRPDGRDPVWAAILDYLIESNRRVEPLYQLEKDGPLRMYGPSTATGRAFIDDQLLRGGQMLGALWLTAWRQAGPDPFLQSTLVKRAAAAHAAP